MDRQLFVLGQEIWSSISKEDIIATGKSMLDANIYNYPYEEFDIIASGESRYLFDWILDLDRYKSPDAIKMKKDTSITTLRFRYYELNGPEYNYLMAVKRGGQWIYLPRGSYELLSQFNSDPDSVHVMNDLAAEAILSTLLVMLATRNVKKDILHNPKRFSDPASKNGIKQIKNKDYKYITTIKIGKITETMRSDGANRGPVRAHLRRGHIRNQRFGEGLKEAKKIFIQPVFVNADEGWIENQRKEYRVKM